MTQGDVGSSAQNRVIRETDPKVWAKIERIEEKFADDDDAGRPPTTRPAPRLSWSNWPWHNWKLKEKLSVANAISNPCTACAGRHHESA
jgi:hypothetical protein